ncbi:alpha/beta hydrolase [Streptomyces sp. HNM1019]|uniref:alpha/beta hydrolase n=1 Tax=Streptomyces sp. HNM1019 TaxID=3424717 RepID=UPI003D789EBC
MASLGFGTRRLRYGPGAHQVGELLRPDGPSRGVVVVLHGGFWRAHRTLEMTAPAAAELTRRGWDTWNVEYRRAGQGTWEDTLADCAAAVDHVAALAESHGLDPGRVFLLGHSAGGHLAAWCAGRAAVAERAGHPPPAVRIRGVVTAGGVLDLVAGARAGTGDSAVAQFLGGPPDAVPARYADADPTLRLPTGVPVRCVHSRADERVPFSQSERYVTAAVAAGDDVRLLAATGPHTGAIHVGSPDWDVVTAALGELGQPHG